MHLRFYSDGKVAILDTYLNPIRVYMQFKKHGDRAKVPDVVMGECNNSANTISFSVTKTIGDYVEKRHYSGEVGLNKLRLKIDRNGSGFCPVNDWNFTETPTDA